MEKILEKLDAAITFSLVSTIFALVLPGILFIYLFNPALFVNIYFFKLILLSCSVTVPVWAINIIVAFLIDKDSDDGSDYKIIFFLISFLTLIPFYLALGIKYIWGINKTSFVLTLSGFEALYFILGIIYSLTEGKKKARLKKLRSESPGTTKNIESR